MSTHCLAKWWPFKHAGVLNEKIAAIIRRQVTENDVLCPQTFWMVVLEWLHSLVWRCMVHLFIPRSTTALRPWATDSPAPTLGFARSGFWQSDPFRVFFSCPASTFVGTWSFFCKGISWSPIIGNRSRRVASFERACHQQAWGRSMCVTHCDPVRRQKQISLRRCNSVWKSLPSQGISFCSPLYLLLYQGFVFLRLWVSQGWSISWSWVVQWVSRSDFEAKILAADALLSSDVSELPERCSVSDGCTWRRLLMTCLMCLFSCFVPLMSALREEWGAAIHVAAVRDSSASS